MNHLEHLLEVALSPTEEVEPVDPEEFLFAVQLGMAAADCRMPVESPTSQQVRFLDDEGDICRLELSDIPLNRAVMAIRDHCGQDLRKFAYMVMRFYAIEELVMEAKEMQRWVDPAPEGLKMHKAVVYAAATHPLNKKGSFSKRPFFSKVAKLSRHDFRE